MSPEPTRRRLSARRGSVSAPDPYAKHADLHRSSFSTLTIVRVNPPEDKQVQAAVPQSTIALKEPPSGRSRFSNPRRPHSSDANSKADSPRMSFAFNSFGGSPRHSHGPPSPGSPRARPSSPTAQMQHRTRSSSSAAKLSPEQLYELAKQASSPRPRSSSTLDLTASPSRSPASPYQHHRGISDPLGSPGSATSATSSVTPAQFRPLPEHIHLPFIDRPAEVASLILSSPTCRLFSLLKQTFPPSDPSVSPGSASPKSYFGSHERLSDLPEDPLQWSYAHLHAFLTIAQRSKYPDAVYVQKIRACILARSELIWERVRGALGVPEEWNDEDYLNSVAAEFEGSMCVLSLVVRFLHMNSDHRAVFRTDSDDTDGPNTSDLDDYGGLKGRGDWDSWDSVQFSPGSDRRPYSPAIARHSRPTSISGLEHLDLPPSKLGQSVGKSFEEEMDGRLSEHMEKRPSLLTVTGPDSDERIGGDNTVSPTPQRTHSPANNDELDYDSGEESDSYGVSIEPMLASFGPMERPGSSSNPHPLSVSDSLGDILEGEEDDDDETNTRKEESTPATPTVEEIHGLKICTSGPSPSSSPSRSPIMNSIRLATSPDNGRRPSKGSNGQESDGESDYAYNPVADRIPGNPLFPSSFARLAAGPTLAAK